LVNSAKKKKDFGVLLSLDLGIVRLYPGAHFLPVLSLVWLFLVAIEKDAGVFICIIHFSGFLPQFGILTLNIWAARDLTILRLLP